MRILAVHELTAAMSAPMRNAVIDFGQMTTSVVAIETDVIRDGRRVVGYGFNSNGRYAQAGLLQQRFIPRLLAAAPEELLDDAGAIDPAAALPVLMRDEKPGGHGERSVAVGVLDMALWDVAAKVAELPLQALLAQRFGSGTPAETVAVYAAGGYYTPDGDVAALRAEVQGYLDAGYTQVKIKIGGAPLDHDLRRIEAVLELVPGSALAVDANARFDRDETLAYAEALAPYGLRWYEEPCDPLDFELHRELAGGYPGAIATGENLFSHQDALNLVRYAGLRPDRDVIQVDPVLAYGLVEYLRVIAAVESCGWSRRSLIPHGGHQMALCIAAGLGLGGNESYPGVFQPFGGFADDIPVTDGAVRLPDVPGIGFERRRELHAVLQQAVERGRRFAPEVRRVG